MLIIEEFGWMAYRIIPAWGPLCTILTTIGISEIISKFTGATFKYSTWLPKKWRILAIGESKCLGKSLKVWGCIFTNLNKLNQKIKLPSCTKFSVFYCYT